MPFSESQLDTWSHRGSVEQSKATYRAVRNVLEEADAPYAKRNYEIFLQGSYGNDTNVYSESDVDVVIKLNSTYHHDKSELDAAQTAKFDEAFSSSSYPYATFKAEVIQWLMKRFPGVVTPGTKAVTIAGNGYRRDADVLIAAQFRRYTRYVSDSDNRYFEGICFWSSKGEMIINYPKHHSENLTTKHQTTNSRLKPTVRILKNMRNRMVANGLIRDGLAPSYYLEGLLYNVPPEKFGGSYADTFVNAVNWSTSVDRSNFVCANERYYLLRENSPVTWRAAACEEFLDALAEFWRQGSS